MIITIYFIPYARTTFSIKKNKTTIIVKKRIKIKNKNGR